MDGPQTAALIEPPPQQGGAGTARFAVLMLAVCCLCWGLSFPVAQRSTTIVEAAIHNADSRLLLTLRPTFNGWRFSAAALAYLLLTLGRQRRYTRADVRGGIIVGVFFTGGVFLQLVGLRYTRPSVSAFLTALAIIFVPLAQTCLLHRPISRRIWLGVLIAVAGTLLLSCGDTGASGAFVQRPPMPYLGELLTLGGSILFTAQILALDRYGQSADAVRLTFIMFATSGILSILAGLAMGGSALYAMPTLKTLACSGPFWWTFACLVLLSCVLAMHLMNRYQPLIAPAIATVVYCLEPVFGTMFSVALGAESLTAHTLAGGAIIITAVLLIARGT